MKINYITLFLIVVSLTWVSVSMKVFTKETLKEFIQLVSTKKKSLSKWQFVYIMVQDPEKQVHVNEVEQFLNFHINTKQAYLLKLEEKNELLLFMHKGEDKGLTLTKFEKAVLDDFPGGIMRVQFRGFDGDGMEKFAKIIAENLDEEDIISNVLFRRMARPGNSIMVLDDDPIVLKQVEQILFGFGNVVTLENMDEFYDTYIKYSPDVLFLDIHLADAKGNEVLKELTQDYDPHAHVIMISSDTQKDIIFDIKEGGAKGFVVKPLDRAKLYQKIIQSPTIITKTSAC